MVDPGLRHLAEVLVGGHEADAVPGADGSVAERLGEEALADADGAGEQDVLAAVEEVQRAGGVEEPAVEPDLEADQSKSSSRQICSKPAWRRRSSRRPWSRRLTSSARTICRKSA